MRSARYNFTVIADRTRLLAIEYRRTLCLQSLEVLDRSSGKWTLEESPKMIGYTRAVAI